MDQEQQLLGFDDPTSIKSDKPSPTLFRTVLGLFLLTCVSSFGAFLWDAKFTQDSGKKFSILQPGAEIKDPRWGWHPYKLEYQLYLDRGFDMRWLESSAAVKGRKILGEMAPFFELFIIRVWGAMSYFMPLAILFLFSVSAGSVHYYDKRFAFRQISSTFYNVSAKVLFCGLPLTLIWAVAPFGIEIPFIGGLPILAEFPFLGPVWLSSPLAGCCLFGILFCSAGFVLGANFSREI